MGDRSRQGTWKLKEASPAPVQESIKIKFNDGQSILKEIYSKFVNEQLGGLSAPDIPGVTTPKPAQAAPVGNATSTTSGEVTPQEMERAAEILRTETHGRVDIRELKTIHDTIKSFEGKTYRKENAILALEKYTNARLSRLRRNIYDLISHIGTRTLGVEGVDYKQEILDMFDKSKTGGTTPASGETKQIGNILDNIIITWKSQYTPVQNFPFAYMTKNPKIAEVQKAIGLDPKYQTGNFGPITKKALEGKGYDVSQGITQDLYNKIMTPAPAPREPQQPMTKLQPKTVQNVTGGVPNKTLASPTMNPANLGT